MYPPAICVFICYNMYADDDCVLNEYHHTVEKINKKNKATRCRRRLIVNFMGDQLKIPLKNSHGIPTA